MTRPMTVLGALAGVLLTWDLAIGQTAEPGAFRKEVSAGGVVLQPRGEFRHALRSVAGGGGLHGLFAMGSGSVAVGFDGQFLFYSLDGDFANDQMIITSHGLLRFRRHAGTLRPYAETLAGFKGFSTDSRLPSSSYGVGAGMQFPLPRRARLAPGEQELLEIGVRYLGGGEARVDYGTSASRTRSVMFHVAMAMQF